MTKITITSWQHEAFEDRIRKGSEKARAMDVAIRQLCKDNPVEGPDRHKVGRLRAQFMKFVRYPMPGDESDFEDWCRETYLPYDQFLAVYTLIYK